MTVRRSGSVVLQGDLLEIRFIGVRGKEGAFKSIELGESGDAET